MISIDSCKIRFHLKDVKILDDRLSEKWFEVGEIDGDIDPALFKLKSLSIRNLGITTSYAIQKRKVYGGQVVDSVVVLFNSKLLKADYLDGINSNTIATVYDQLIKQKIIDFSFETFVKSALTDVDIKKDFEVANFKAQLDIVKTMRLITKMSERMNRGCRPFESESNLGIEWNTRKSATESSSYVKVYSKDIELNNNSMLFRDSWLNDSKGNPLPLPSLMRLEASIKNKKHFKYLLNRKEDEYLQFDLDTILMLSQETFSQMLARMCSQNLTGDKASNRTVNAKKMTVSEALACSLLESTNSLKVAEILISKWTRSGDHRYNAKKVVKSCWTKFFSKTDKQKAFDVDKIVGFIYNPQELIVESEYLKFPL
jgi:hypothetical protein